MAAYLQTEAFWRLQPENIEQIRRRRRTHNRLGFGYQLCFVRLTNRFPVQKPFEIYEDILSFASVQLDIPASAIDTYAGRQPTISEHQEQIREYLGLRRFDENEIPEISKFVFEEACRLEQTVALLAGIGRYLREHTILKPSDDTLRRLIAKQRRKAKKPIRSYPYFLIIQEDVSVCYFLSFLHSPEPLNFDLCEALY